MANVKVDTVPSDIGKPPTNRTDFLANCNHNRVKWLDKVQVTGKGDVTPGYGVTDKMSSDDVYHGSMQEEDGLFQDNGNKGWKLTATNGNSHQSNAEIKFKDEARWFPAALFNGCGFEVHQDSNSKHAMWIDQYALIFIDNQAPNSYKFVGNTINDGHNSGPHSGYRYADFSYQNYIDQIRGFGPNWYFYGLILHIKNNGGAGSDNSTVKCWNFKMFHKGQSSSSSKHRIVVPALRPLTDRGIANRQYQFT